ncbi:MAG: transcriptional repressor LexA [Patescibacteria group bacterium]
MSLKVNTQSPLTPKQKKVLDFVNRSTVKYGYAPSLNEIAEYLGKSISTVQHFIEELQEKGYLQKKRNVARGLSSTQEGTRQIFKLGLIAAGVPIDPIENPEPIDVPLSFLKNPGNYYALQVKGDSMVEDNILDGDTIIIRHQQVAEDGDRVVAITEEGATLKVFRKRGGKIYLEPRNQNLKPIYPKRLEVRGKFCGLIRRDN